MSNAPVRALKKYVIIYINYKQWNEIITIIIKCTDSKLGVAGHAIYLTYGHYITILLVWTFNEIF